MPTASCISAKTIFTAQAVDCQLVLYRINISIRNIGGQISLFILNGTDLVFGDFMDALRVKGLCRVYTQCHFNPAAC